jgi:hypothetical protein
MKKFISEILYDIQNGATAAEAWQTVAELKNAGVITRSEAVQALKEIRKATEKMLVEIGDSYIKIPAAYLDGDGMDPADFLNLVTRIATEA